MQPISISVQGLSKRFGTTEALKKISLDFSPGKMHGIIGPEGAGKTTLMRVILGLLKPSEGKVVFGQGGKSVIYESIDITLSLYVSCLLTSYGRPANIWKGRLPLGLPPAIT